VGASFRSDAGAKPLTPALRALTLLVGGGLAGVVGTAGGITTLVSYPLLLATGVPALVANVTNIVAVTACWPGSALASGKASAWLGLMLAICALVYKLRIEERWMLTQFGDRYREYRRATWALLPFVY